MNGRGVRVSASLLRQSPVMGRTRTRPERGRIVTVPHLAGLDVPRAHDTALDGGVLAVEEGVAGHLPERRVTGQQPPGGETVPWGSTVQVWTSPPPDPGDPGGGGGDGGPAPVGPGPVRAARAG